VSDDRAKASSLPATVAELVTTGLEAAGAGAVAAGVGFGAADVAGTPAGLVVGGLAAVAASWVLTGGVARAAAAVRKRRELRRLKAEFEAAVQSPDGPVLVPEPAVLPAARPPADPRYPVGRW